MESDMEKSGHAHILIPLCLYTLYAGGSLIRSAEVPLRTLIATRAFRIDSNYRCRFVFYSNKKTNLFSLALFWLLAPNHRQWNRFHVVGNPFWDNLYWFPYDLYSYVGLLIHSNKEISIFQRHMITETEWNGCAQYIKIVWCNFTAFGT